MDTSPASELPLKIGTYQIVRSLGKGGMGEVFLAFDPRCGRYVALKQIRHELSHNLVLQERFLREAKIASQLTHPSIIPIFTINRESSAIFYTMPYVEGETLKQILRTSLEEEQEGEILHPIGNSIPALIRIFLNVCQAIAYCHSKGILHRDLKPENIIVGKYGEVLILDWGLADFIGHKNEGLDQELIDPDKKDLTRPGKIAGTLSFLAPERVLGHPSSVLTDIYSLGVILYQLLTLRLPFHRPSIHSFRKLMHLEKIADPQEIAPYRDIPQHLSDIVKRCLEPDVKKRFQTAEQIIAELKSYVEGRPEWIPAGSLDIRAKKDWEFQENILLTKHIAISRTLDVMEWVSLMISQASFSGNTLLKTQVRIKDAGSGIGFLLSIPEASERIGFEEGYCLWIGSPANPHCKLFRSNVEVMDLPGVYLHPNSWHTIQIEKVDNHLRFYLDDEIKCHLISHTPMNGTHIGLLYKDADFDIDKLDIYVGSLNAMVNCLAVPDAFLANKNYSKALIEYRRIGSSFSGRAEGREALFRAGVTLLEEASTHKRKKEQEHLYMLALEEFSKLRFTPGAPLEYLGKSLVYKASKEIEEEIKCLELCVRKYPKHPLLKIVIEHIIFRLHEASSRDRISAYHLALLVLRHLPYVFDSHDNRRLLSTLKNHLEPLPFILPIPTEAHPELENLHLCIQLAFWLTKPITLIEIIENCHYPQLVANAFYCLLELGYQEWVKENLHHMALEEEAKLIELSLLSVPQAIQKWKQQIQAPYSISALRSLIHLSDRALTTGKAAQLLTFLPSFSELPSQQHVNLEARRIWALLLQNRWQEAHAALERFGPEQLFQDTSPLYPLMGCWLLEQEGREIAYSHFSIASDLPYPPTTALLGDFLHKRICIEKGWFSQAFFWEKIQLFRQLHLFYHTSRQPQKAKMFYKKIQKEYHRVKLQYS